MRTIRYLGKFKQDFKRMEKRGNDLKKLRVLIEKLVNAEELETRYKDHPCRVIMPARVIVTSVLIGS